MPTKLNAEPKKPTPEVEQDLHQDTGVITTRSVDITSLSAALKYSKVDMNVWEVERHVINTWETTMSGIKSSTGKDQTYTNYQVKIWLKKRQPTVAETLAEEFCRLAKHYSPKKLVTPPKRKGQFMYEVAVADPHIGKLAHSAETGWQNYDSKIAASLYRASTEGLLTKTPAGTEEILIVLGNDQFNADNQLNQTTGGTPQDCDSRFPKVYRLGCNLSVEFIDKALSIAPVRIVIVPGNHDNLTAFHLGEWLKAWYRHSKHVTIDNAARARKYVHYGVNLLGLTHGDKQNALKHLPSIMAAEQRDIWGQIRFSEWHIGHFHSEKVVENVGVVTRTLSAICPPDQWHSDNGYIGSRQRAQGFAWHKARGLEDTFNYNIDSEPVK